MQQVAWTTTRNQGDAFGYQADPLTLVSVLAQQVRVSLRPLSMTSRSLSTGTPPEARVLLSRLVGNE